MATRSELEQVKRALNRLSKAARADLAAFYATLDPEDRARAMRAVVAFYPELVDEYGKASAALGADMAETWAGDLGVRPRLSLALPSASASAAMAEWAMKRSEGIESLAVEADRAVKQPYRDTVQRSAHESGVAWARVPSGSRTCAFCLMAASRGAVYRSASSAGADHKYHGDCDCQVVMVRSEEDYPEGYEPGAALDLYLTARGNVEGKPTTNAILAEMRKIAGNN